MLSIIIGSPLQPNGITNSSNIRPNGISTDSTFTFRANIYEKVFEYFEKVGLVSSQIDDATPTHLPLATLHDVYVQPCIVKMRNKERARILFVSLTLSSSGPNIKKHTRVKSPTRTMLDLPRELQFRAGEAALVNEKNHRSNKICTPLETRDTWPISFALFRPLSQRLN